MRSPRIVLVALTVAFGAAGAAFALTAPLFQAPDEPPHLDKVRHHAASPFDLPGPDLRMRASVQQAVEQVGLPQGGPLPWSEPRRPRPSFGRFDDFPAADSAAQNCRIGTWTSCQNYHYVHPPTYYLLLAPLSLVLERFSFAIELLWLRLAGVALVAPVVALTWYGARQVWPRAVRRPLAAAAAVASFAPLAANAAAVNNDSLTLLLGGVTIAVAARLLRRPAPGPALALGVAVGAGLLVKSEFLAIAAAAGVVLLASLPAIDRPLRSRAILGFLVPAVVGSAWWLRSLVRFRSLEQPGSEILQPVRPGPWNDTSPITYALDHAGDFLGRAWGLYGQTAVDIPSGWRVGLNVVALLLAAGWLACRRWDRPSAPGLRFAALAAFPLVLAAGAMYASYGVYKDNGEVRGLLGRYLYASLPVITIAAAGAAGAIALRLRARPNVLVAAWTALVAGLGLASYGRALHGFYGTRGLGIALERAATVSAVPSVAGWLAALGTVWLVAIVVAVVTAGRAAPGPADIVDR